MRNTVMAMVLAAAFGVTAHAESEEGGYLFDGGWRISVGAAYNPRVKSKMKFVSPAPTRAAPVGGMTRSEAKAKAADAGVKKTDTLTEFANGAWIDTDDPVVQGGDDIDRTRYYGFPGDFYNESDGTFTLARAYYSEVETRYGGGTYHDSDRAGMPGINVELSRNLCHDEEYGWGVDVAFDFFYFRRNDIFSASASWLDTTVTRSGRYEQVMDFNGGIDYDEWNWHGTGASRFYGSGLTSADRSGNAGPINGNLGDPVARDERETRTESRGSMKADGDYDDLELTLMLRPYYDVFDWLRINTVFGVVVSRQELDLAMSLMGDGAAYYRSSRHYSQWDVYGVAGAGLMLTYDDFTISADFFARFLDDELDLDDSYLRGTVDRGEWLFRLAVGYEF